MAAQRLDVDGEAWQVPRMHTFPRIDLELSRRVERAQAALARRYVEELQEAQPEARTRVEEQDGALLVDAGPTGGPNASRGYALGMQGPVTVDDVIAVERFFEGRPARVNVSPLADPSLLQALHARGFLPIRFDAVLVAHPRLQREPLPFEVRSLENGDLPLWLALQRGTYGDAPWLSEAQTLRSASVATYAAFEGAAALACASLSSVDDVVMLFGGTTLPSARERGAQRTLIDARLDAAARQGLTLAISVAAPGSGSERNLRRAGFTCAYTAALYERPADRRTSA